MEHGLKHIAFKVKKHIVALTMCYNPVLVCDKTLGAPTFCETGLFKLCYGKILVKIYLYPSGLFHCHWGNHMIAPVSVK